MNISVLLFLARTLTVPGPFWKVSLFVSFGSRVFRDLSLNDFWYRLLSLLLKFEVKVCLKLSGFLPLNPRFLLIEFSPPFTLSIREVDLSFLDFMFPLILD